MFFEIRGGCLYFYSMFGSMGVQSTGVHEINRYFQRTLGAESPSLIFGFNNDLQFVKDRLIFLHPLIIFELNNCFSASINDFVNQAQEYFFIFYFGIFGILLFYGNF